jgi:uncharacterized protein (TIGR02611 family)
LTEPAETSTATAPAAPKPPPRRRTLRVRARHFRARVRRNPRTNLAYRIAIGVLGTLVLVLGVLAIPYPGPGWLIVFAGLGILATEFTWAGRVLRFARYYYDQWVAWISRQNLVVKLVVGLATFAIVVATLWLLGALSLVAGWVGLDSWTWLQSPIGG